VLDEVSEERGIRRKFLVVDVAIQKLVHCKDEPRHFRKPSFRVDQPCLRTVASD